MSDDNDNSYWRSFGYLPTSEWTGDNMAITEVPIVLNRFQSGTGANTRTASEPELGQEGK